MLQMWQTLKSSREQENRCPFEQLFNFIPQCKDKQFTKLPFTSHLWIRTMGSYVAGGTVFLQRGVLKNRDLDFYIGSAQFRRINESAMQGTCEFKVANGDADHFFFTPTPLNVSVYPNGTVQLNSGIVLHSLEVLSRDVH